jgi:phosphatidylserine/phosphatidylglycerophosphate/cardiolipin synthase-like enzyme
MIEYITDIELYTWVVQGEIPRARRFLWIATSDLKDMHVVKGKRAVPFLEVLSGLVGRGVSVRLIHAKEPGANFRRDFDRYPNLIGGLERLLCPRAHFKAAVVDGRFAYTGSANITGAGMGAKAAGRRNFESGIVTDEKPLIRAVMKQFDEIWMGARCRDCRRKEFCADYREMLE